MPEPLIPTSSTAMATTDVTTGQVRSPPQVSLTVGGVPHPIHASASAPALASHSVQTRATTSVVISNRTLLHNMVTILTFFSLDYRSVPLHDIGAQPSGSKSPKCEQKWPHFPLPYEGIYAE